MAFKAKVVQLLSTNTTISQMGSGLEGAVHGLVICNNNAEARTLTLKLLDSSEGATATICVKTLQPGEQFTWPKPINLESGDALIGTGADLVALHSTYVGTAAPITTGFTGRGEWSSVANYNVNDVVSRSGNSYLSNGSNTNSQPPSANWTLIAAKGSDGIMDMIRTPVAVSPTTGGLTLPPNGPLEATTYAPVYGPETRLHRTFQVTTPADTGFATPVVDINANTDTLILNPVLGVETAYIWRCKDVSVEGRESSWMPTQAFTTKNLSVVTPTVTVTGSPSSVTQVPTISTSAYATAPTNSANHVSTDWEIRRVSDNLLVWSSMADTTNLLQVFVPPGVLLVSTQYAFRARHNSSLYGASGWGSANGTTLGGFSDFLYNHGVADTERPVVMGPHCTSAISATKFVTARAERPPSANSANPNSRIILSVGTDTGTSITINRATEVLVADGFYSGTISNVDPNSGYEPVSVAMLSATHGIVTWATAVNSNICAIRARAFSISGDAITLGDAMDVTGYTSTTSWARSPRVVRMTDSSAVIGWELRATSTSVITFKSIYLVGLTLTASTGAASHSSIEISPIFPNMVRISDTVFASLYVSGTSSSYTYSIANVAISGTGSSATLSIQTPLTVTDTLTGGFTGTRFVMLTTSRALVYSYRTALSTAAWYTLTLSGHTWTLETAKTVVAQGSATSLYRDYQGGLVRLSDTTALSIHYGNTARVVTVGATITETVAQALTTEIVTNTQTTALTPMVAPGSAEGSVFLRTTIYTGMSFSRISMSGNLVACSAIFPGVNPAYETHISYMQKNADVLSASRAIVLNSVHDAGYGNGVGGHTLRMNLLNIAGDVPSVTRSYIFDLPGRGVGWYAMCALSSSRALVFSNGAANAKVFLVSVTDAAITVLSSVNFPEPSAGANAFYVNCCRLSDTTAAVVYQHASTSIPNAAMITVTGDTVAFGTPVAVSPTAYTTWRVDVAPFSASRAVVVYPDTATTFRATLINCAGGVVTPVVSNVSVAPNIQSNGVTYNLTLKNIDSTRVLCVTSHEGNTANSAGMRVIQMVGDTLSVGGVATRSGQVSNAYGVCDATPLSPTRGIVLQSTATPSAAIEVYSYTLGAGASTPVVSGSPIAVLDSTDTNFNNPFLRCLPITGPQVNKSECVTALLFDRDGSVSGGTGDYRVRKFLRGTL